LLFAFRLPYNFTKKFLNSAKTQKESMTYYTAIS